MDEVVGCGEITKQSEGFVGDDGVIRVVDQLVC